MTTAIAFITLFASHLLCLWIGWKVGTQADPNIVMSKPDKSESKPYHDPPDLYHDERLDIE